MSDIGKTSLPGSLGGTGLAAGFLATRLLLNPLPFSTDYHQSRLAPFIDYRLSPSSYGEHATLFAASKLATATSAALTLESFYVDLMARQERLGREFEQVLFENLWDLYAR